MSNMGSKVSVCVCVWGGGGGGRGGKGIGWYLAASQQSYAAGITLTGKASLECDIMLLGNCIATLDLFMGILTSSGTEEQY